MNKFSLHFRVYHPQFSFSNIEKSGSETLPCCFGFAVVSLNGTSSDQNRGCAFGPHHQSASEGLPHLSPQYSPKQGTSRDPASEIIHHSSRAVECTVEWMWISSPHSSMGKLDHGQNCVQNCIFHISWESHSILMYGGPVPRFRPGITLPCSAVTCQIESGVPLMQR